MNLTNHLCSRKYYNIISNNRASRILAEPASDSYILEDSTTLANFSRTGYDGTETMMEMHALAYLCCRGYTHTETMNRMRVKRIDKLSHYLRHWILTMPTMLADAQKNNESEIG